MTRIALLGLGLVALGSMGCASKTTPRSSVGETTLQGTAALSSYTSVPRAVLATDETGRVARAAINADGSFSLVLARAHTYHVDVLTDAGAVPLVFPRTSGKVTKTFVLKSDGARLALGNVRFVAAAAPKAALTAQPTPAKVSGLHVASLSSSDANDEQTGGGNDDQNVQCEDGSQGNGQSGAELEGSDSEADATGDTTIAEHNVPESVDGCGVNESEGTDNGDNSGDNNDNTDG